MADESTLGKVRALLAKAESTEFPAEAEAFIAKAEELMARHAIDQAMLDASDPSRRPKVTLRPVEVHAPYVRAKALVLAAVAEAYSCRTVMSRTGEGTTVRVFGADDDIDLVETIFTSLLAHAARTMPAAEQVSSDPQAGTRAWRQSFLIGFATRVRHRLRSAKQTATAFVAGSALVLRDRKADTDAAVAAEYPNLGSTTIGSSGRGGSAGRAAADTADLGQTRLGGRRAIEA